MLITIIEKEVLSNQSSIKGLKKAGYDIELFDSITVAMKESTGDMYLLSTGFSSADIQKFMVTFSDKVILLLANHYSNELLSIPMSLGAKDYFIKPIDVDVLIHKIKHYELFDELKKKHTLYKNYHNYVLRDVDVSQYVNKIEFPMIVVTNNIAFIDQLILAYANLEQINMVYISLENPNWIEKINMSSSYDKLYISGLENLSIKDQNILFRLIQDKKFIISSFTSVSKPYKTIEITTSDMYVREDGILTISDYALMIIKSLQFKYPDVKIAEKLGYSRKKIASIRKKFNLARTERVRA